MKKLVLRKDGNGYWIAKVPPAVMDNIWETGVIDFPFIDHKRQLLRFHVKSAGALSRNLWLIWENAILAPSLPSHIEHSIESAIGEA